ncbi:MAG: TIGR02281 family clan AA aspartic protease [Mesorhizobium amorphae]|nr:MAG: TIGR02281 family clan AA aspartic protease [Mesorhizobium amorphae]
MIEAIGFRSPFMRNLVILGLCGAVLVPMAIERSAALRDQGMMEGPASNGETPAPAAARRSPAPSGRTAVLEADERGHFLTELKINGRRIDGLIDTGATAVALNLSAARRLGIAVGARDFVHVVETANGSLKAAVAVADRIEIGRVSAERVEVLVLDDRALQTVLVGMSFLKQLSRFEVKEGRLVLMQ